MKVQYSRAHNWLVTSKEVKSSPPSTDFFYLQNDMIDIWKNIYSNRMQVLFGVFQRQLEFRVEEDIL